jgi:hypothetical protein
VRSPPCARIFSCADFPMDVQVAADDCTGMGKAFAFRKTFALPSQRMSCSYSPKVLFVSPAHTTLFFQASMVA